VAVNINSSIMAFLYWMSCGLIEGYQHFGTASCLHLQGSVKDLSTKHCFSPQTIMIFTLKYTLRVASRCESDVYKCSEMQVCNFLTKVMSSLFCPHTDGFGSVRFNIELPRPALCPIEPF
jgi:hypothetical protein